MKIRWHCRGCGKEGQQEVTLQEALQKYDPTNNKKETVIDVIMKLIPHECENKDLGVGTV